MQINKRVHIDKLYDLVSGNEDARVCKDIRAQTRRDQPRNLFACLAG